MRLSSKYEPNQYEEDIYALWEKEQVFLPVNRGSSKNYVIVVPPPNANGDLHIGHALTLALEDIVIRYHRMKGEAALLLPGADHAGFETQAVYEKQLAKEGKSRFDFSREELYQQIWDFVSENKENYEQQFRKLGASVDWSRYTFTLDEKVVQQAYKTFKKMWDEGLIYRGERLVNYCTHHGTGFADIEVSYKEVKGNLWHIKYSLTDKSGEIVVATTRPETMLGDVAVAVHPDDKRYKNFIGKTVKLPLTNREIPILADKFVDAEFGTGAVKITPAHDPNDFEIAKRHDLPLLSVIGYDGKLNHNCPEKYRGLSVKEGRGQVVKDLKEGKFLDKEEDYAHSVGHCYKCGTVIEPLLKEQWFLDMQPLAQPAIKALRDNKIKFYPDSKKEQLIRYLEGLKDWNISRQIAWGIPIPAYQNVDDPNDWIYDERVEEELIEVNGKKYKRDPDVFDTWFSSSSWPYATLGGPGSEDFKRFYPNSLMETGGEILYPWVSRMIMLGLYIAGEIPFENVYIHGYVMAEDGAKMSKSLGNVVAPLPVVEKYGSDALRMGIISGRSPAVNRGYDSRRVEEARNFCNKLWNIARFAENAGELADRGDNPKAESLADNWIVSRINSGIETMSSHLDNYRFSEAYETLYHLVWDDLADWYIEASKNAQNKDTLAWALKTCLKLAHPFAPFVTETIWQTIYPDKNTLLAIEQWPKTAKTNEGQAKEFEKIKALVTEIRQIKTTLQLQGGNVYFKKSHLLTENNLLIAGLAKLEKLEEVEDGRGLYLTKTKDTVWIDIDAETAKLFTSKLDTRKQALQKQLKTLETRLSNQSYVKNAPKELVEQSKQQSKQLAQELDSIEKQLTQLEAI